MRRALGASMKAMTAARTMSGPVSPGLMGHGSQYLLLSRIPPCSAPCAKPIASSCARHSRQPRPRALWSPFFPLIFDSYRK